MPLLLARMVCYIGLVRWTGRTPRLYFLRRITTSSIVTRLCCSSVRETFILAALVLVHVAACPRYLDILRLRICHVTSRFIGVKSGMHVDVRVSQRERRIIIIGSASKRMPKAANFASVFVLEFFDRYFWINRAPSRPRVSVRCRSRRSIPAWEARTYRRRDSNGSVVDAFFRNVSNINVREKVPYGRIVLIFESLLAFSLRQFTKSIGFTYP